MISYELKQQYQIKWSNDTVNNSSQRLNVYQFKREAPTQTFDGFVSKFSINRIFFTDHKNQNLSQEKVLHILSQRPHIYIR